MITKTKVTISIDAELYEEFKKAAKEDCINMSGWIQSRIEKYLTERSERYEKSK